MTIDLPLKLDLDKAIENLLKRYEELEEENKEYKQYLERLNESNSRDFIFRQQLIDKIEELKKQNDKEPKGTMRDFLDNEVIRILQELLEERK